MSVNRYTDTRMIKIVQNEKTHKIKEKVLSRNQLGNYKMLVSLCEH